MRRRRILAVTPAVSVTRKRFSGGRIRVVRTGVCLFGAASLVTALAMPSIAHNMAPRPVSLAPCATVGNIQTDDKDLYVHYDTGMLSGAMRDAAVRAWAQDYNPSDLVIFDNSSSSQDLRVYHQAETTYCGVNWLTLRGFTDCKVLKTTNGTCDVAEVHFDSLDTALLNDDGKQSLACHEFGHVVGLKHATLYTSCMRNDGVLTLHVSQDHEWKGLPTTSNPDDSKMINYWY